MKVKRNICRLLALVFTIAFCVSCLSCGEDTGKEYNEFHTTKVKKQDFSEYGNFVYSQAGKFYRYNRKTGELHTACMDPECDGNCPLDSIFGFFAGIVDQRMYFSAWQQFTHNVFLAYQDIVTGEVKVLKTMSEIEDSGGHRTFIENGWWYYKCKVLKAGGDATIPTDYEPYIYRIALDGSKDEAFAKCEESEMLVMVGDGKILTQLKGIIYSMDIETKEKKELFVYEKNGYIDAVTPLDYLDGKIYFLASTGLTETSEYSGSQYSLDLLVSVDIRTGEVSQVVEKSVLSFCLTEEGIYYAPFKIRHLYVPENYEKSRDQVKVCIIDESLYMCDLNGDNIRKVYTNEKLIYSEVFTVIDDVLIGWMHDYNEETHAFGDAFLGAIEFESGEIIRSTRPE